MYRPKKELVKDSIDKIFKIFDLKIEKVFVHGCEYPRDIGYPRSAGR